MSNPSSVFLFLLWNEEAIKLAIPRSLATGSIIVSVFEVSVVRRFWFSAP